MSEWSTGDWRVAGASAVIVAVASLWYGYRWWRCYR